MDPDVEAVDDPNMEVEDEADLDDAETTPVTDPVYGFWVPHFPLAEAELLSDRLYPATPSVTQTQLKVRFWCRLIGIFIRPIKRFV